MEEGVTVAQRSVQSLPSAIWIVLIAAFLDMMAMGIVLPVLPRLIEGFTGSLSAASLWTGLIGSLWALMQLICAPVIGALSDRFGRRPVILSSIAGLMLDWIVMALAPNLWWLVVGRTIGGITSASATALFACTADVTLPEQRARAFGLVGATASAGFILGPALGGVLGEWGPRTPFWTAAALSAVGFLYAIFILPETLPAARRSASFVWRTANPLAAFKLLRSHADLSGLAASGFLLTFAQRLFMTVFVLFAGQRFGLGPMAVGALFAFSSVIDVVVQGFVVGLVTARIGDRRTTFIGLAGGAIGMLAMGFAPTTIWFVAAMTLTSLMGLAEPTIRSLMSARVSEAEQGQLQGAVQSLASLAGIAGPAFFGWVYATTAASMPGLCFVTAAGVLLLAAASSAAAGRRPRSAERHGRPSASPHSPSNNAVDR